MAQRLQRIRPDEQLVEHRVDCLVARSDGVNSPSFQSVNIDGCTWLRTLAIWSSATKPSQGAIAAAHLRVWGLPDLCMDGGIRFVQQRQVELREVEHRVVGVAAFAYDTGHPAGDRFTLASGRVLPMTIPIRVMPGSCDGRHRIAMPRAASREQFTIARGFQALSV